jgi:hypothetical protein
MDMREMVDKAKKGEPLNGESGYWGEIRLPHLQLRERSDTLTQHSPQDSGSSGLAHPLGPNQIWLKRKVVVSNLGSLCPMLSMPSGRGSSSNGAENKLYV